MLDGCGLHTIIWDSADERLGNFLVASPADATGRGLELHVRQGGAAADLTGADGTTFTPQSPIVLDNGVLYLDLSVAQPLSYSRGCISIDLSNYASLNGSIFTGPCGGVTPTQNNHFATKQYVDNAIASIASLEEEEF